MSVIAAFRNLSELQFYETGLKLRKLLESYLLRNFNTREKVRNYKTITKDISIEDQITINDILDKYDINNDRILKATTPEWYCRSEQEYLMSLIRSMMNHIVSGITIETQNNTDLKSILIEHKINAITDLHTITEELYELQYSFPTDLNLIEDIIKIVHEEDTLLNSWINKSTKIK